MRINNLSDINIYLLQQNLDLKKDFNNQKFTKHEQKEKATKFNDILKIEQEKLEYPKRK